MLDHILPLLIKVSRQVPVEGPPNREEAHADQRAYDSTWVNYHMEHVFSYHFRSPDAELYLRRVCHNILDWGVRSRRAMLERRCEKMYTFERVLIKQDAARMAEIEVDMAVDADKQDEGAGRKRRRVRPGFISQGSAWKNNK